MDLIEVKQLLDELSIKSAYRAFPVGVEVATPFIVFYESDSRTVYANNINYFNWSNITIELYVNNKDLEIEQRLETKFLEKQWIYTKNESYIETEKLIVIIYTLGGI